MPNWCSTEYFIEGSKESIDSLSKILETITASDYISKHSNGFEDGWLGDLVIELGKNWEEYTCRGSIIDWERLEDEDIIHIYMETAWCEQEGVRHAIEETFPDIKVYFQDEESGCENYTTNDADGVYFDSRYFMASDWYGMEYFRHYEEIPGYVQDKYPDFQPPLDTFKAFQDYCATWSAEHEDEEIRVYAIEVVND